MKNTDLLNACGFLEYNTGGNCIVHACHSFYHPTIEVISVVITDAEFGEAVDDNTREFFACLHDDDDGPLGDDGQRDDGAGHYFDSLTDAIRWAHNLDFFDKECAHRAGILILS